jgi:hypothetical protein
MSSDTVNPLDWLDGQAPLIVRRVNSLSAVTDTSTDDDGLLKYFVEFAAGVSGAVDTTKLNLRFDADPDNNNNYGSPPVTGQIAMTSLIELTFPGDVRTSLVPDSLTYSG